MEKKFFKFFGNGLGIANIFFGQKKSYKAFLGVGVG